MRIVSRLSCALMIGAMPWLATVADTESSPASRRIALLEQQLTRGGERLDTRVELALAWVSRARETAEPEHYERADTALDQVLETRPDHPPALRARVAVLLGRHRFEEARSLAQRLLDEERRSEGSTGDVTLRGYLLDACVELGRYDQAWTLLEGMLVEAPGAPAVLARGSYLAELFGDVEGATLLMERAMAGTPERETEEHAWFLTHLAHLDRQDGESERAEKRLVRALELFPGYHYALAERARLAESVGDVARAVDFTRRRCEVAPHPECFYDLAVALESAGKPEAARIALEKFEPLARAEMDGWDNANRELIKFYLEQAEDPEEALRVAVAERSRRGDVHTRAFHAAALRAVGRTEEARLEMEFIHEVGTRDPVVLELIDEGG